MKRRVRVARVVWVVCLFLFLLVILFMVMDYKINYQYLKHSYLYFYECSSDLCVSSVKDSKKDIYSIYDCGYNDCPMYKNKIDDQYAILLMGSKNLLYNYKTGLIILDDYDGYEFIDGKAVIVKKGNYYGIVDINKTIIVNPIYDEIGIHTNEYLTWYSATAIVALKNEKYGAISYKDGKLVEEFEYDASNLEELLTAIKKSD